MKKHVRNLVSLLNTIQPVRRGAEIGVFRGETSKELGLAFPGIHLILVDPWTMWKADTAYYKNHSEMGRLDQSQWDENFKLTLKAIQYAEAEGGSDFEVHVTESVIAAQQVEDQSLDFVFIDADHSYEAVKADILAWRPKIRTGGIIAGHDYKGFRDRRGDYGVSRAVHEIFGESNVIQPVGSSRVWAVRL